MSAQITMNIGAVERDTGLSKDALRVWERRYGFPSPSRDALGERAYPPDQVEKLRILRRLIDRGYRPGKIIQCSTAELQQLIQQAAPPVPPAPALADTNAHLQGYVNLCKMHQADALRQSLTQALSRIGLERFVVDLLAPLNRLVGEGWANGSLQIFEEHLYTEAVQMVLRSAISALQRPQEGSAACPRILLTTLLQEQHGLGLLMAEAICVLEGASCISLGVQTPVADIVSAAHSQAADIVALSFSDAMNPRQVLEGLAALRSQLPAQVGLWAGGQCPVLRRRPPPLIRVMPDLIEIGPALLDWRTQQLK